MFGLKIGSDVVPNSEKKKILNQYRRIADLVKDLVSQRDEIDKKINGIKGGNITGMPRGGNPLTVEDMIADKMDIDERINKFLKIEQQKKEIVQDYIDTVLSPKHNRLLTLHYIKGFSINEIADKENYTYRHAWRIYSEALDLVDISLNLV